MKQIVVTRHPALLEYLIEKRLVKKDVEHVAYADVKDVSGKHVFGVLPLKLACHAAKITEIQLRLPPDKRGVELTLEELHFFAIKAVTYSIKELEG